MEANNVDDVRSLNIDKVMEWLDERGISYGGLTSLSELHDRIAEEKSNESIPISQLIGQLHGEMEHVLETNTQMKKALLLVYDAVISFYSRDLPTEIQKHSCIRYGEDMMQKLVEYKKELLNDECSIVVIGETSAGKSSFFNLLLGEEVLPSSLLCSTKMLCHIHSQAADSPIKFEVTSDNGFKKSYTGYKDNARSMIRDLESVVTNQNSPQCKVDIYWHIPMLGNNKTVTLIDTPGVGASQQLSERLLGYLPNAIGIIYIINSSNAGGLQYDRSGHIFDKLKRDTKTGGLFSFDPDCMMFVLNQWDKIEQRQVDEPNITELVWQDTLTKLTVLIPEFEWETRMYKMSVTTASVYQKQGIVSKQYRSVLKGLKKLVVASLTGNVKRHFRWLTCFTERIRKYLKTRLNNADYKDKDGQYREALTRLSQLELDAGEIHNDLKMECKSVCQRMVSEILCHLASSEVKARIISQGLSDETIKTLKVTFVSMFSWEKGFILTMCQLMEEEVNEWEKRVQFINKARDELQNKFYARYHTLCEAITKIEAEIESESSSDESTLSDGQKIILIGVGVAIGYPIILAVTVALLPIVISRLICMFKWANNLNGKEEDEFYEKCFKKSLKKADRKYCEQYVNKHYFSQLLTTMADIVKDIPRQINACKQLVQDMTEQRISAKKIQDIFTPPLLHIQRLIDSLQVFHLHFLNNLKSE
ncbi:uncharacterized protein LOC127848024 isoform X2 [Dreissena polymorpha]|nr:uncharacterized protein LOC127848024 isoform X2 [Dreissena polymorpha]XP_052236266.1 uncharacterized protein LOC127848024 isoform X2 [Dreissena polymorpha]XP_052236267.1 uncharacterized protein LOC127848024 isoform X2 [Dreissena polymorpha]